MMGYEEITLEMARMERQMLAAVRAKVASQQLGEAWVDLGHPDVERSPSRVLSVSPTS